MVGVEEPALSETHGLGEPSQAGGYLMTLAKRGQENMAPLGSCLSGKTMGNGQKEAKVSEAWENNPEKKQPVWEATEREG